MFRKKNITASNEIMKAVQDTLTGYPFKFSNSTKQARILSDVEEGSFAWITSNYITGAFHVVSILKDIFVMYLKHVNRK